MKRETIGAHVRQSNYRHRLADTLNSYAKYAFVLPAVLYAVIWAVYPMIDLIGLSLSASPGALVSFEQYQRVLTDETFKLVLVNTLTYVVPTTVIELVLGIALALAFYRDFPFKGTVQTLFLLPMVLTPFAVGMMFQWFFSSSLGIVNYVFETLGFQTHVWLGDQTLAMLAVILTDVWQWTPFIFLMVYATLQSIPEGLIEAAKIDGAGRIQRFRYVMLPHLYPVLLITGLIKIVMGLKNSDKIMAMTGGGPGSQTKTLTMYINELTFQFSSPARGAAMSVVFLVIILAIGNVFLVLLSRAKREV